jgi:UDP-3-O-[3-hydroxymyristoyl] glucosamine N-acyltransferase
MIKKIKLKEIIEQTQDQILKIVGNQIDIEVSAPKDMENIDESSIDWVSTNCNEKQRRIESTPAKVIIIDCEIEYTQVLKNQNKVLIIVPDIKKYLITVINKFFTETKASFIHPTAIIDPTAEIGTNVSFGPYVVLGKCKIGNNVSIGANSFINDNVFIGNNVEMHSGVSIGNEAHNFLKNDDGSLLKFPHIGGVIINDDIVIGTNSVISRGVLGDTVIEQGVKIAQLVFIGANNKIGKNCSIRPNVMTSGSVEIGDNTIIAPSTTIREHCRIGNNCMIGMGSVVTKSVPDGEIWFGNPARKIK